MVHVAWHIHRNIGDTLRFLLYGTTQGPARQIARDETRSTADLIEWLASPGHCALVNLGELQVFEVQSGMPASMIAPIQSAILGARATGLDVTMTDQQNKWLPNLLYPPGQNDSTVQFVPIFPMTGTPPTLSDGKPEHIDVQWDARLLPGGTHEALTSLDGVIYLQDSEGHPADIQRAIRYLIAYSQGVESSTAPGSALAFGNTRSGFSMKDIAAMQVMSGCQFERIPQPASPLG